MATPSRWMEAGIQFLQCRSQRLWKGKSSWVERQADNQPRLCQHWPDLPVGQRQPTDTLCLCRAFLVTSGVWEHPVCCPWYSISMKDMGEKTMPLEKAGKALNVQANPLGPWGSREFFIIQTVYFSEGRHPGWGLACVSNILWERGGDN